MIQQQSAPTVKISIDIKKYRIRIHKNVLHLLDDPPYVQLLINPESAEVAIRSVEKAVAKDQAHRVSKRQLKSDNCIEIYSKFFIQKLIELVPKMNEGQCYHMSGVIIPFEKAAVFSFKTLTLLEGGEE